LTDTEARRNDSVKRVLAIVAAVVALGLASTYLYDQLRPEPLCEACHRAIHDETLYRVHLKDGRVAHVCCPRCGLRFQEGRDDVASADVADFLTQDRVDAEKAFYVEDSSVVMCRHDGRVKEDRSGDQYELTWDRCLPSLVAFSSRASAEAFRKEKGGVIKSYDDLKHEPY
jgi:hypothetical protein